MEDKDESLTSHLEALRSALIKCFAGIAVLMPVCFYFSPEMLNFFVKILIGDTNIALNYFSPMEVFFLQMKIAFFASAVLAFPYIAKNVWDFILPALYDKERKFISGMVLSSTALFCAGAVFCFFLILPVLIKFGLSFQSPNMHAVLGASNVVMLSVKLSFVFGVMFQFPLVNYALIKSGLVSYESMASKRAFIFIGVLIVAAIVTPPDIISQIMLTVPTYGLFELSLLFARRYKGGAQGQTASG